ILSGFLMSTLYPQPHQDEFIERRYTRIFPPFITMVLCMGIFRVYPQLSLFSRIVILFAIAALFRVLWVHVIEKLSLGRLTVKLFLFFQLLTAIWYGFFIMRLPSVWFHSLPSFVQWTTTIAVNATLTLPLGDYVPMLDIVYWTLICEILFYLLYPSLIAPLVLRVQNRQSRVKALLFFSLFPFFFGTALLFKELKGLSIMDIEYFIYFFIGISIAIIAKQKKEIELPPFLRNLFHPLFFFLVLFASYFISVGSLQIFNLLAILFLSIPLGFVVYGLLDNSTALSRFFSNKFFIFLGAISYSLYICSTSLIDGMRLLYKPINALTEVFFLIVTLLVIIAVSYVIHNIIESPYFMFKPMKREVKLTPGLLKFTLFILIFIYSILIFSAYSSQFNFFSQEKTYNSLILSSKPLIVSFIPKENNMGVVLIPLTHTVSSQEANDHRILTLRLKESNAKSWYATQETNLAKINKSGPLLFGFPTLADSKNKKYILEINSQNIPPQKITLNTTPLTITAVSQMDKRDLVSHPLKLLSYSLTKLESFFSNRTALIVSLCIFPLLVLILFFV
ncbi:MAG: acyltransferase family protein, partial [Candidatus Roizmanbacteria bacterium]|nr:acyltransferase family protein [Candidatus Roizmanbacteria bacterium]